MLHFGLSARGRTARSHRGRLLGTVLFASLVSAALQLPTQPVAAQPPAERPNILLVTTDDQAATDMAHMDYAREFFAEGGATFTDAVSPYPLCCPARATILTGQLSHNHGVLTNKAPRGGYEAWLANSNYEQTLPTWLQADGYRTMFVGKYLNGYGHGETAEAAPPPGWDAWNALAGSGIYDYFDFNLNRNGTLQPYSDPDRETTQSDVFGDITRQHIQESVNDNKPFFIWESNLAPHGACHPAPKGCRWGPPMAPDQDLDEFAHLRLDQPRHRAFNERVVRDKPEHIRSSRLWGARRNAAKTEYLQKRAGSLQAVDRSLAQTVDLLSDLGELDDTLIIFTSDNGYLMGQHRWQGKILPYEPSLQVPFMMRGPGVTAGLTSSETVALVDLAPTIAAAAGVTPTLGVDGQSLLPVATGAPDAYGYGALSIEAGPQQPEDGPAWFYHGVRTSRYTYVVYPRRPGTVREVELYDRREDPHQLNNVAYRPAYRDTRSALAHKLAQLRDCHGPACYEVEDDDIPGPQAEPYLDSGATVHPDELGSVGNARQVVTLTAPNWRSGRGRMTAWSRTGRTWTVRRGPSPVLLGSNGLVPVDRRRHGGGEAPAGTFRPGTAFGTRADPGTALRYRRADQDDYWAVDRRSRTTYNVYQPRRSAKASWRPSRAVRWADHSRRFRHALVMRHNLPQGVTYSRKFRELRAKAPADVRRGSFIVHVGNRLGRHGWVSTRSRHLRWLLRWMRPRTQRTTFVVGTPRYMRSRL